MKWKKFISREGVDLTTISGLDVVFYDCIRHSYPRPREPFFTFFQNKIMTHYLCVDEIVVGRRIYQSYFTSPKKVEKYYRNGQKFLSSVTNAVQYWKNQQTDSSWMLKAFSEFRRQFNHINYHFSIWPWWGIEAWQVDFEKVLSDLIRRRNLTDFQEVILASVNHSWKKTALIELQDKLDKKISPTKLAREYQFLRSWSVVWARPIDAKWIKEFAKQGQQTAQAKRWSLTKILTLLRPTSKERYFLELAPYITFFKDWRDDVRRQHVYQWGFLFDALAKHFDVARDDFAYLSLDEIETVIRQNKFPTTSVARRQQYGCVVTTKDGSLTMQIKDKNITRYENIVKQVERTAQKDTKVQGLAAQPGVIRGIAKVIYTYHDIKRFKDGDILIANTTHPNYLPAMQKAAAFVTNEGGIISHAAIVARELHKPCIVGTKIATQAFKDGDFIEVNATKGFAKKV